MSREAVIGNRRAESGYAFEQGTEAKADDDQHHPPIVRQVLDHPRRETHRSGPTRRRRCKPAAH